MPIRVAVTGQMHGPELPNTIEVLGKRKSIISFTKICIRAFKIVIYIR